MKNTCVHCAGYCRGCDGVMYVKCMVFDKHMECDERGCTTGTRMEYCDQFTTNPNEED